MAQNKQFFRVEGDAVHLVTERVERTVRLQDLIGEVAKEAGLTTPILPTGCRFFRQKGDRSMFVIEQAPQTRQLKYEGSRYKLAFPYVVFILPFTGEAVNTDQMSVYYRTKPLTDMGDSVSYSNLWNLNDSGVGMCTGSMRVEGSSLAQKAESFISGFWRSEFNSDITGLWNQAVGRFPQVNSIEKWQEESAKNPLFPLGIKWFEAGRLSDVIEGRC